MMTLMFKTVFFILILNILKFYQGLKKYCFNFFYDFDLMVYSLISTNFIM